jgi:DNA-binding CsgD family transcriptional regulator
MIGQPAHDGEVFTTEEWSRFQRHFRLSERETAIAKMAVADTTEELIAARLGISTHTVHTYMFRLYRKIGVSSRTQLVGQLVRLSRA